MNPTPPPFDYAQGKLAGYLGGYFTISFSSADTFNFAYIPDASVGVLRRRNKKINLFYFIRKTKNDQAENKNPDHILYIGFLFALFN